MLKLLFQWFDAHPGSYWALAGVPTLLLVGWIARAWRSGDCGDRVRRHDRVFAFLLLAVLLAWRWPFLLAAGEYNPDESQLIAGAMTLRGDLVPWRSLDGSTSGPLNFYALLPISAAGLPLDYFTARLTGLLLVWGALLACYRLFRTRFEAPVAQVSVVPALAFFCTVVDWDFIQYSTEHLSLFLTALGAGCVLRKNVPGREAARWHLAGCFAAGLLPWCKLQSAPIGAAIFAISIANLLADTSSTAGRKVAEFGERLAAALVPSVAIIAVVLATGQFHDFFVSYLRQNIAYVGEGAPLGASILGLWRTSMTTLHFPFFFVMTLAGAIAGSAFAWRSRPSRGLVLASALLVAAAIFAVLAPRRALVHYLLLSIIPLTIWLGAALGECGTILSTRSRRWLGIVVFAVGGVFQFLLRTHQPDPGVFGTFLADWRVPRSPLADIIRTSAPPGARLAIWGWIPGLFVQSGLPQGTRDGNSAAAIMASAQRDYYRQRFLADLRRNRPAFFVDAVGPGAPFFTDRAQLGHESFPELANYVRETYRLVLDARYARLYVAPSLEAKTETAARRTHFWQDEDSLSIERLFPADLPTRNMFTGAVQMILPPAEIVWTLDATTREIEIQYGFDPKSYHHGRSDGAELSLELEANGVPPRHLFHRFLDPSHRTGDRGDFTTRVALPPFKSGARLVARTTSGKFGDAGWDWIYLARATPVRMATFSPAQFPRFNRVPDAADADLSYLLYQNDGASLMLDAPAALTFNLHGQERRLHFDYGFQEGAYSNGGHTDGATFVVELRRAGQPSRTLFSAPLNPAANPDDRGRHSAEVALPENTGGSQLFVRIDPGSSNAWDWTYITDFVLE
jgi:hypothetical protein